VSPGDELSGTAHWQVNRTSSYCDVELDVVEIPVMAPGITAASAAAVRATMATIRSSTADIASRHRPFRAIRTAAPPGACACVTAELLD
jgi:hypothetical protein